LLASSSARSRRISWRTIAPFVSPLASESWSSIAISPGEIRRLSPFLSSARVMLNVYTTSVPMESVLITRAQLRGTYP
jgi:hypothetical protein